MSKRNWMGVVGIAVAVFFLTLPAAAQAPKRDQEQNLEMIQLEGLVEVHPADSYVPPAVMGIQKTINVPAAAFFGDGSTDPESWQHSSFGYLYGRTSSATIVQAPVHFPKGAKKIIRIDFLMRPLDTGSKLSLYMNPFSEDITTAIYSYSPAANSAWTWFSYTWPKETRPQIAPWNQYFLLFKFWNEHYFKSVIITYQ